MANEFVKKALLLFIVGIGYILSVLAVTSIVVSIAGVELVDSLASLAMGVGTGNMTAIAVGLASLIVTGGLVAVWVKIRPAIARTMKLTVTMPPLNAKKKVGFIVTLLIVGVITSAVLMAYAEFTANLFELEGDIVSLELLYNSLLSGNILLIVSSVLAIIFFGFLVGVLGRWINPIEAKLPINS